MWNGGCVMSERKLIVLGTASQVPGRTRNHNGYFLRFDDEGFLFDPGEGTQRQMLLAGVSAHEITRILITHFHGDHCLGLAGIIQRISLDRVPHEVEVYFPASDRVYFERLRDSCRYFPAARLRDVPVKDGGCVAEDARIAVFALALDHTVETYGYRIVEKDSFTLDPARLAASGVAGGDAAVLKATGSIVRDGKTVRVEDIGRLRPGQRFAFVMDTRVCDAARDLAREADLCVMEATYLSDMEGTARDYGHLTARQAATIAREAGVRKLVLSHFSQRYGDSREFVREASPVHPDVVAAEDGMVVNLPRRRRVLG